mmetsp:Transcript_22998/g.59837  ORF Transcript_22998/g.59837 Transcript_22998/m.59837 type:complete len:389 (+) Transcript_22998:844-2010(+)
MLSQNKCPQRCRALEIFGSSENAIQEASRNCVAGRLCAYSGTKYACLAQRDLLRSSPRLSFRIAPAVSGHVHGCFQGCTKKIGGLLRACCSDDGMHRRCCRVYAQRRRAGLALAARDAAMARRRQARRALSLALLGLQIQSFQLPTQKIGHRRRPRPCEPLRAAPYDAAEALYAYIASPSPVHDALHAAGTAYAGLIDAHPLATKSVTNAVVGVTGDAIAQRGQVYDRQRAARYALKGLGGGLLWAFYFDVADAFAVNSVDGPAARVALQMALEQFFWVPLYVAFYDLPFASRLNGVPARRVPNVVRDSYVSTLVSSAKLWTPANLLVYSTPVEYRLLVSNIFDLAWNTVNSDISASCSEECPVGDGPPGASRMCPPERPPSAIPTSR